MKILLSLILGVILAVTGRISAANLIVNGDFETGNLTGWTFTPAGSGSSLTVGNNAPFGFGNFSV